MSDVTTDTVLNVIEILKGLKGLLGEKDPYLPVYSALGGAFIGAVSTFIPTSIVNWINHRRDRKSLTLAIYAEISATIEIICVRNYFCDIEQIINNLKHNSNSTTTYQIIVPNDYCLIYKNNVSNIGKLNPNLQVLVVKFYQILEAIIQDVRPGGILNTSPQGLKAYEELLAIGNILLSIGNTIKNIIEKTYSIKH